MIRVLTLAFVILCALSMTILAEENFVSLFNGKDLSGWVAEGTEKAFVVRKEAIYTTGASPYPSWLRSEAEYENFVLRFEYQTEGWYEGGFLFHAPSEGPASKLGLKLHIRHDQHEYGKRSPGALYDAAAPTQIANLPSGQWNQCEIECDWPTLRITLNGKLIHDINMDEDDAFKYRLRKGHIGIQNIGCRAYFRNIEIRTLPAKEEWNDLFQDGLEGLNFMNDTDWQIEGDTLIGKGNDGHSITKAEFEPPYELQVWVKTMVNGNGGVCFNWSGRRHIETQCFNAPDSTNPTGSLYNIAAADRVVSKDEEWFLMQIYNLGSKVMVRVNGEQVCETDQLRPPYKGGIAFQQHTPGGIIHYRGARIKNLSH